MVSGKPRAWIAIAVLLSILGASALLALGGGDPSDEQQGGERVVLYFFWREGCPHCARAKPFLEGLEEKYPQLEVQDLELKGGEATELFQQLLKAYGVQPPYGVPAFFIGERAIIGYRDEETTGRELEEELRRCLKVGCPDPKERLAKGGLGKAPSPSKVRLPLIGEIDPTKIPLPLLTVLIAGVDGFNPCAIWVLCFLLTLLVYYRSRGRMLLVGGIFVFASGLVYFLFMSAWLNLFLLLGYVAPVRVAVGAVAVVMGAINVKDFFLFRRGPSLMIPESAKPGLIQRMRATVRARSLPATLLGVVALAFAANFVELLCTTGFPAIYTRILTLQRLSAYSYYLYLLLYNLIYVIPLAAIVALFAATMGTKKFTERQGRVLKLIGGALMLALGLLLIFAPEVLTLG